MSKPVFALSDRAEKALAESRQESIRAFNHGIYKNGLWYKLTLEQAQQMHREKAMHIYKEGLIEVSPDSTITIECPSCHDRSSVSRSVKRFRCKCSPMDEQFVHKCRI